ncbi:MAG: cytochrome c biogenesis protein ResB [Thermodesulfobacteriota bacterium]
MSSEPSLIEQIVDFLASVKLALTILIVLAVTAVAGTIIPQNLAPADYIMAYGPRLYTFLGYLDLFDMYRSWWFTLFLGLLAVNLIVCSVKRLPRTARLARPIQADRLTLDFLKKQPFSRDLLLSGPPREHLPRLKAAFHSCFGPPRAAAPSWGTLLWSDRGAFSRYGVYLIHLSILVILAGAAMGGYRGFSGYLELTEGQTKDAIQGQRPPGKIPLSFAVRLDKFAVSFYPSGAPSEFRSDVTIIENGRAVHEASILVNHPLTWRGVTFYQSSYGRASSGPRDGGSTGPRFYTGLQANHDPGVWLIWLGCGMMFLGFLVTFFFAHRKAYLGLAARGDQTLVLLAGSSHRHQGSFKIKFERLAAQAGREPEAGENQ